MILSGTCLGAPVVAVLIQEAIVVVAAVAEVLAGAGANHLKPSRQDARLLGQDQGLLLGPALDQSHILCQANWGLDNRILIGYGSVPASFWVVEIGNKGDYGLHSKAGFLVN